MRKDPYKVLGVDRTATDDEIKSAYRELAKKYHPDNYVGSPLADLAQEKMKEINEAYDKINRQRQQEKERMENGFGDDGSFPATHIILHMTQVVLPIYVSLLTNAISMKRT